MDNTTFEKALNNDAFRSVAAIAKVLEQLFPADRNTKRISA